jgi:hypothetical protein
MIVVPSESQSGIAFYLLRQEPRLLDIQLAIHPRRYFLNYGRQHLSHDVRAQSIVATPRLQAVNTFVGSMKT